MKKELFSSVVLCLSFQVICNAQISYVPGAVFTYDAKGNRIQRHIGTVCIGCPKPGRVDSLVADNTPISDPVIGKKISVQAYPNPANTDLTIENHTWNGMDKVFVIVSNMLGQTIVRQQLSKAKEVVPFASLTPGTYLVSYFINEQSIQTWQIIKL